MLRQKVSFLIERKGGREDHIVGNVSDRPYKSVGYVIGDVLVLTSNRSDEHL